MPKNLVYTNPAQPRRVKKDIYESFTQSPHRAKKVINVARAATLPP
jgi:hypothetical protein